MTPRILEGPKLKNPLPSKSLGQLFFDYCEKYGDRICQVDGTLYQTETYHSCKERSTRVAIELQNRGVTSKDVIAFCTGNTLDTVIPILATFFLGAKVANLEPSLSIAQTEHLISLAKPKIIFVEEAAVSLIENSLKAARFAAEIIVYGRSQKYATVSELTTQKPGEADFKPPEADLDDIAIMFFSSGTTGLPKAICHTHRSYIHMGCTLAEYGEAMACLHFTTFYWITASFMLISSFIRGGMRVFCRSVEAENVFKVIEKYKIETAFLAPLLTTTLTNFDGFENYDTSSLRIIHVGGGPITAIQLEKMRKVFKHSHTLSVYGQSEAGVISVFHPNNDTKFIKLKPKSCGKPFHETLIKVVNEDSNEILGPNQRGEIYVKTPALMKCYYNQDSSQAFDGDGFVKTGDIGFYDEDNCLYIVERSKEMFKFQSWHIVPSALEAILQEHPSVKEAAVFGVPWGDEGEAPGAGIVLKDQAKATQEEIFDFVAKKVSEREKLIGGITFLESLPKTPTGKLVRKEIRNLVLNPSGN